MLRHAPFFTAGRLLFCCDTEGNRRERIKDCASGRNSKYFGGMAQDALSGKGRLWLLGEVLCLFSLAVTKSFSSLLEYPL